jgi:hypothetical protein
MGRRPKKISYESVELYIYRTFALVILVYHLIKFLYFEFSHW